MTSKKRITSTIIPSDSSSYVHQCNIIYGDTGMIVRLHASNIMLPIVELTFNKLEETENMLDIVTNNFRSCEPLTEDIILSFINRGLKSHIPKSIKFLNGIYCRERDSMFILHP